MLIEEGDKYRELPAAQLTGSDQVDTATIQERTE
jgi:hypothetical protein